MNDRPSRFVASADGTEIAVFTSGDGPPLVLVHGAAADHTTFRVIGPRLAERYTVHAIDRRGRGSSGDTPPYAIEREFEDVAAVADAIGDGARGVPVIGHSYGGRCALGAALLTDAIAAVVCYEGAPTPPGVKYGDATLADELAALERAGRPADLLEGKRGEVRAKPPLPAHIGLFGKPTVINNVLSLASVPIIMSEGATHYRDFGMGRSRGTMPIQLAGNIKHGGLFETAFGISLGELVDDIGGGTRSGRPVRAVQVGGPLGAYFPRSLFDTPFDYEAFTARDGLIGHGGIVVFDDTVDMAKQARFAMECCAIESCGKCTPCRIGSARGVELVDKIVAGDHRAENITVLEDLCNTMKFGSLCALGGFTPYPVMSALTHFPEDFGASPKRQQAA